MQKVSSTYERLSKSNNKTYETKLVIDGVGEFYEENDLRSVSTNIACFSGAPKVGTAVSQEITVAVKAPSVTIPRMGCIRLYIRATGVAAKSSAVTFSSAGVTEDGYAYTLSSTYASHSNGKITFAAGSNATVTGKTLNFPADSTESLTCAWIPQGVFFIDTREVTANYDGVSILSLHGFDAMMKAEQEYTSNATVGMAADTEYVQTIANEMGVSVDSRTWDIMRGYLFPFPIGYTMREVLGYIAASYVGYFVITEAGKLRLISLLELPAQTVVTDVLLGDENGNAILFGDTGIIV